MIESFYCVILAGGLSKRMNSRISKVLHKISGKTMVEWAVDVVTPLNPRKIFVVGNKDNAKLLREALRAYENVEVVVQEFPKGTGDAVKTVKDFVEPESLLYVAPGDAPLIRTETIKRMLEKIKSENRNAVILSAEIPDPSGYGRIIRDGNVVRIVEHKDATEEERRIKEVNGGFYIFRSKFLFEALSYIDANNSQGEYYLTDVFKFMENVEVLKVEDWREILGVNTREQLAEVERVMQEKIKKRHMENGVTFIMPDSVYVEYSVRIGEDTTIYPFVVLLGNTKIGKNCTIGPFKILKDVEVEDGTVLS